MSSTAKEGSKLRVFISYSRQDLEFADQLVAVLELYGFLTSIDRKGIHGAEKWEERLGQLRSLDRSELERRAVSLGQVPEDVEVESFLINVDGDRFHVD